MSMNDPRIERLASKAAMVVSKAFVSPTKIHEFHRANFSSNLTSRIFSLLVLVEDAEEKFSASPGRTEAFLLAILADFCWQFIRNAGSVIGKDHGWLVQYMPEVDDDTDKHIGDSFHGRIKQIVDDAEWIYDLHSFIRHPKGNKDDKVWIICEPTPEEQARRLTRAASGIKDVLRATAARLSKL